MTRGVFKESIEAKKILLATRMLMIGEFKVELFPSDSMSDEWTWPDNLFPNSKIIMIDVISISLLSRVTRTDLVFNM